MITRWFAVSILVTPLLPFYVSEMRIPSFYNLAWLSTKAVSQYHTVNKEYLLHVHCCHYYIDLETWHQEFIPFDKRINNNGQCPTCLYYTLDKEFYIKKEMFVKHQYPPSPTYNNRLDLWPWPLTYWPEISIFIITHRGVSNYKFWYF